ncbi:MAG: hypothetical protein AAF967_10115, partial [Pseudomonadota bacterium]
MRRLIIGLPTLVLMTGLAAAQVAAPQATVRPQHVAPPNSETSEQDTSLTEAEARDGTADGDDLAA